MLQALISESAEELSKGFYDTAQRDAAIRHVFGVDAQLIADQTYFVIEIGGEAAACGGWSRRETLFGGDQFADRRPRLLDPASEAARIRAFFVHPRFARRGLASMLLEACETAAVAEGFAAFELMATLSGVPFYTARGFNKINGLELQLDGVTVRFVGMRKVQGMTGEGATAPQEVQRVQGGN